MYGNFNCHLTLNWCPWYLL